MPQLLKADELDVIVDHHLFGVIDSSAMWGEVPQHELARWLRVGTSAAYIHSEADMLYARLRLEAWDGPAPFDHARWPNSEVIALHMSDGNIRIDQLAAGPHVDVVALPWAGHCQVRMAWRPEEGPAEDFFDADDPRPGAFALAQFWPDPDGSTGPVRPARSGRRGPPTGAERERRRDEDIRDWAHARSIKVDDRRPIPLHIIQMYDEAHG